MFGCSASYSLVFGFVFFFSWYLIVFSLLLFIFCYLIWYIGSTPSTSLMSLQTKVQMFSYQWILNNLKIISSIHHMVKFLSNGWDTIWKFISFKHMKLQNTRNSFPKLANKWPEIGIQSTIPQKSTCIAFLSKYIGCYITARFVCFSVRSSLCKKLHWNGEQGWKQTHLTNPK